MTAIDAWLGAAYRLAVLEANRAGAVSGMNAMLMADHSLAESARAKLASITPDMKQRDTISVIHSDVLAAALVNVP